MYIWNYNDQTVVKSFEVTELPGAPLDSALCPVHPLRGISWERTSADVRLYSSQGMSGQPASHGKHATQRMHTASVRHGAVVRGKHRRGTRHNTRMAADFMAGFATSNFGGMPAYERAECMG